MHKSPDELKPTPYSFRIADERELLSSFHEKDRKKVILPRLLPFPVEADYYYAWSESSGVYLYLLFKKPDWERPRGMIFRRAHATGEKQAGRMCDWCHAYGGSDQIGMMTFAMTPRISGGIMVCLDLNCLDKLETIADQSKKSLDKLATNLCEKIGIFFQSALRKAAEKTGSPDE